MKPAAFDYYQTRSVVETTELLDKLGTEAKVIAGGQSLVPLMNMRLARPEKLIDIDAIRELSYIKEQEGEVAIGALTRHAEVAASQLVRQECPLLAKGASLIGHPQIRNRGTIGGSLCHADPAAEFAVAAMVLGAKMKSANKNGTKIRPASEFFVTYLTNALEAGELLTEIIFPKQETTEGWAFLEVSPRYGDVALVLVAAVVGLNQDGKCNKVSVVLGGVGPVAIQAKGAETTLLGGMINGDAIDAAVKKVVDDIDPDSDVHASANYRREVAQVLTKGSPINNFPYRDCYPSL